MSTNTREPLCEHWERAEALETKLSSEVSVRDLTIRDLKAEIERLNRETNDMLRESLRIAAERDTDRAQVAAMRDAMVELRDDIEGLVAGRGTGGQTRAIDLERLQQRVRAALAAAPDEAKVSK